MMGETVNRAARLLRRLADMRLGEFRLSSGYLPVVTALMEEDGLTQKALVKQAVIEQPTMVNTLARMERDGIIERRPDPSDGRSFRFSLTGSIKARAPEIRAAIQALNDDAISELTEEERIVLSQALLTMSRTIAAVLQES